MVVQQRRHIRRVRLGHAVFADEDGHIDLVHVLQHVQHVHKNLGVHLRAVLVVAALGHDLLAAALLIHVVIEAIVEVEAVEVHLLAHGLVVARLHAQDDAVVPHVLHQLFGVAAQEQRVQEHAVAHDLIVELGAGDILGVVRASGIVLPHVHHDADLRVGQVLFPEQLHRLAVAHHQVVHALSRPGLVVQPRGEEARGVTHVGGDGLVEGDPVIHIPAEVVQQHLRVAGEPLHHVTVAKAALGLQRPRQVPMEHGGVGNDATFLQQRNQLLIIGDALRVHRAGAVRDDAPSSLSISTSRSTRW